LEFSVAATKDDAGIPYKPGETIKGTYYPKSKRVVVIASDLRDSSDLHATLRHEILAHYGLNLFDSATKASIIDIIKNSRNVRSLKSTWAEVDRNYTDISDDLKSEEVLSRIASRLTLAFA